MNHLKKKNFHFFASSWKKKLKNNYHIFKLNYLTLFFLPLPNHHYNNKKSLNVKWFHWILSEFIDLRQMISLDFEWIHWSTSNDFTRFWVNSLVLTNATDWKIMNRTRTNELHSNFVTPYFFSLLFSTHQ
jgi:hypothetical protein